MTVGSSATNAVTDQTTEIGKRRILDGVDDLRPLTTRDQQAVITKQPEVLGHARLTDGETLSQRPHRTRPLHQGMQNADAGRIPQSPEAPGYAVDQLWREFIHIFLCQNI
jgi:hypothetical protein